MARLSSVAPQVITPAIMVSIFIYLSGRIDEAQVRSMESLNEIQERVSTVEAFLKYSPIIDLKDSQGKPAVHKAIDNKDTQAANELIDAGIDVNITDNQGLSPLDIAIFNRQPEIAIRLIDAGADVNIRSNRRFFSSDATAANGQPEIEIQRYSGIGVQQYSSRAISSQGFSPLYIAIASEQPEIVSELIDAGADVNVRNNQGFSPLDISIASEQPEIVSELIAAGADKRSLTEQQRFAARNQLEEIRNLIL